jgi:hypothetical protein
LENNQPKIPFLVEGREKQCSINGNINEKISSVEAIVLPPCCVSILERTRETQKIVRVIEKKRGDERFISNN